MKKIILGMVAAATLFTGLQAQVILGDYTVLKDSGVCKDISSNKGFVKYIEDNSVLDEMLGGGAIGVITHNRFGKMYFLQSIEDCVNFYTAIGNDPRKLRGEI